MNNTTGTSPAPTDDDPMIQVGCRFRRSELLKLKQITGAIADAVAVACYVRKRLAEEQEV